jgi:predicted GH43/DUF377 family glycosyl hydrolase
MNKKAQMEIYIKEIKRLANKKKGVIPDITSKNYNIKKLSQERKEEATKKDKVIRSKYSRSVKPLSINNNLKTTTRTIANRDLSLLHYGKSLVSLNNKKITRLDLPRGCFNAGLAENPNGGYVCVYRPDEYSFTGCFLNEDYQIEKKHYKFKVTNCADPRLLWVENNTKLLMTYSSTTEGEIKKECIRGMVIMDLNISDNFIETEPFRISPEENERHKNWMPFIYEDSIFLISSVIPHKIYELNLKNKNCELKYENNWFCPWPIKGNLRGNTNAVKLNNGNYLSTFHTSTWIDNKCYYDNGIYIFEGKPPFKVLKCSNKTYLPAEDAVEPYFRKAHIILCPFPVGMVAKEEKIIISYGDNDSCVKILETNLEDLEKIMLEIY